MLFSELDSVRPSWYSVYEKQHKGESAEHLLLFSR